MRKLLCILASTVMLFGSQITGAVNWTVATPYAEQTFHTRNIQQFAQDITSASGGALQISIAANESAVKHDNIPDAVARGEVQAGEFLLSNLSEKNAIFEMDAIPFLAPNYYKAQKLWEASRPEIERALSRQGLMVLFSVPWPPQGLFVRRPISSTSDLRGTKMRTYNATTERFARRLGASPVRVATNDIAQAFQQGRVNAMFTSPSTGVQTQAWTFATNYYDAQAWTPKNIVVVNKKAFAGLDSATQRIVREAAERAEARGWDASQQETRTQLETLRNNGVQVHRLTPKMRVALRKIGQRMVVEWTDRAGASGINLVQAYYSLN